jgi:hypothetical protein
MEIPFLKIDNFNDKLKRDDNPISTNDVDVLVANKYIEDADDTTKAFIKTYVINLFSKVLNGDLFRSQADNLTKFSQYILENKINNPDGRYNKIIDQKYKYGDTNWIEDCYFKLYFTRNPNKSIYNIQYEFKDADQVANLAGGKLNRTRTNKKSRNNKKITNKKSRNNRTENNSNKLINNIVGGRPGTPENDSDDDFHTVQSELSSEDDVDINDFNLSDILPNFDYSDDNSEDDKDEDDDDDDDDLIKIGRAHV